MTTPNLSLPELVASQSQPHVTVNTALRRLDALAQATAISETNTPPGTPAEGDTYIVGTSPTGVWTGHGTELAVLIGAGWTFIEPAEGWLVYNTDQGEHYRFDGAAWVVFESGGGGGGDTYLSQRRIYSVIDERASPPGGPAEGDTYLMNRAGDSLSGAWSGWTRGNLAYYNGTAWEQVSVRVADVIYKVDATEYWYCTSAATPRVYKPLDPGVRWPIYKATSPSSSEVLGVYVLTRTVLIPADFAGSQGAVGANPSSSFVLSVELDGSPIGTITISTGGAFTFSTSSSEYGAGAGSTLAVIAPSTTNGSIARIALTLALPGLAPIPF